MRREAAVGRTLRRGEELGGNATLKAWVLFSLFHSTVRAARAGTRSVYSLCRTSLHWAWLGVESTQCLLADGGNGCPFFLFLLQIWGV